MRRARRAVASASLVLALVLVAGPAHAADVLVEVGLRLGYLFGRGWVIGPGVSLVRTGSTADFLRRHELVAFGGLSASGDLVLGPGALDFRVHVGPEMGAVKACPTFAATVSGGAVWIFRRGAPVGVGLEGGGSLLGGLFNPSRSATSSLLFSGFGYRFVQLLEGPQSHEVDLDVRAWTFPFNFLFDWPNLCGALGGAPKRSF